MRRLLRNGFARSRKVLERDELRIPIQTAAAVLLSYAMAVALGLAEVTWAAFSSLFVVQASIGGTLGTGLWRVAGALIGSVIGVALVASLGVDGWHVFAALFIGVGAMSVIAARWPDLSYGLVTVTIIIVTPGVYVVEGAIAKVGAILLGSTCAIITTLAVLPISAHRSADAHLAAAVRECGEFLVECMHGLAGGNKRKKQRIERRITRSLNKASSMSQQAFIEKKMPAIRPGSSPDMLLPEIERFRYTLTLLDRASDKALSRKLAQEHEAALHLLTRSACKHLKELGDAIESCTACAEMTEVWDAYNEFSECVDGAVKSGSVSSDTKEQLMAMKWACHSVLANMNELTEQINSRAKG